MGGVDKADQYSSYYSFTKKSVKWWRKLMFWLLEVGIVNSYIVYRCTVEKPLSSVNYRRQIILVLCENLPTTNINRQRMRSSREDVQFQGRHYVERRERRRSCKVCSNPRQNERHNTLYYCKTCPTHPPLHVDVCFERYHELVNFKI